ncbi:hypothetical protein HDU90_003553 [Geranomyces variabilis]|nr:hypothetical protein HDU90_003553 [Geranomyces variabilis]
MLFSDHGMPTGKKQFKHQEVVKTCGEDPDFAKRDLYAHIKSGGQASWKLFVQVMSLEEAEACPYDPFDVTKV